MREGIKIVPRRFGAIAPERTISLPHPEGYNTKIFSRPPYYFPSAAG